MAMKDTDEAQNMSEGRKNKGEGSRASKILEMTHNRKHNPGMEPVQSKRVSPSAEKSNP